ncbi:MAG: universal stress protein [Ktedonobacteraceae bacterium]
MFKRILVPLDGSPRAEQALPVAARLAQAAGGAVVLLQVVSPPIDYAGGVAQPPMLTEQFIETELAASTSYLATIAHSAQLAGIDCITESVFGLPWQDILAVAASRSVDLIVMCSHGRTGFTRWMLGSVAHQLVHQSTAPVFVVRENAASLLLHADAARPLCALVPLDGSLLAETALDPAAHLTTALAAPARGILHLAQVVKVSSATAAKGVLSEKQEEDLLRAETYLGTAGEHVQATLKDCNLSVTCSVELETDVASALMNRAEQEYRCDLIVISTHGRSGLERWVMGSVTERLLTTTRLPMLIVRPQHKGDKGCLLAHLNTR